MSALGANSLSPELLSGLLSDDGDKLILDPSCGVGSFLVAGIHAVAQRTSESAASEQVLQNKVVGIDKSERMVQLAITNLSLLGARRTNIVLGNALDRRTKKASFNELTGQAALILTNPPFGAAFSAAEIGGYELFRLSERDHGRVDSELLFLERYIEWLCPGGVLVAIVPDSLLTNQGTYHKTRGYIAKHCDLLSVVSLPPVTFAAAGTTTKTSILHLRKKPKASKRKDAILTYFALCEDIGYEVITRGSQRRKIFKSTSHLPTILKEAAHNGSLSFGCRSKFDTSAERWDAKYNVVPTDALTSSGDPQVPLRELATLVSEKSDPRRLGGNEFDYIEISDVDDRLGMVWSKRISVEGAPSRARKRVKTGDVLMSTVRPERGCIGVVSADLDGAICSTGFAVLRPKNINPYLLAFLLKSPRVTAQVERQMSGIAYPAINENLIPELILSFDTSQRRQLNEAAQLYKDLAEDLGKTYRSMAKLLFS
jgi:N-6 DNA Methylase